MPQLQLYDKLLTLPLFQGMSHDDLAAVVGQTKFGFQKVAAGKVVAQADAPCTHLYFLLSGRLQVESCADTRRYTFVEDISAPAMLQPERLFGLTQRYSRTFTALTDSHFITLDKTEVLKLSNDHLIFQLNFLNILSAQVQRLSHQPWRRQPESVRDRILRFLEQHCLRPAGEKTVRIKMEELAVEICDSRLNVSRALNAMQSEGLMQLSRGTIRIPRLEQLLNS